MADVREGRLPRTVIPTRYALRFEPDLDHERFTGRAAITVQVREPVSEMVLNALDLTLDNPRLSSEDGTTLNGRVTLRPDHEQALLHWPTPVQPGTWTLDLDFAGKLARDLRGFYVTEAKDADGRPVKILATHSEPTDARRFFPCWDEPDFKARFHVTLVVPAELQAFSNGREVENVLLPSGKRQVTFADTIPMSTYLLALVVGPLAATSPVEVDGIPVRIVARPEYLGLTAVAQEAAVDTLRFYRQYFDIPCPADKMDHVAVPDFSAGAMENLGCVIYREQNLLLDPDRAAPIERMNVFEVIAHETAHMWFGDLVTMRWWNGIWLNEAFATFMELLADEAIHPEWDAWTTFSHGRAHAMGIDALKSSRPIEFPVGRPAEAQAMFDALTYQKGGAILRMIQQFLGPDVFRRGVTRYLAEHRYGNTETEDLWNALEAVSGQPVRATMTSWVFQAGYPILHVTETAPGRLQLRQQPFQFADPPDRRWQVPVTIRARRADGTDSTIRTLLTDETASVAVPEDTAWMLVNAGGAGFYRTAYDAGLWRRLVPAFMELSALERLVLTDDAWAGLLAGHVPLSHLVELWRHLDQERDPDVFGGVGQHLGWLDLMGNDEDRAALRPFVRRVAQPVWNAVGWDPRPDEDIRKRRLRATVLGLLGGLGADPDLRHAALARFRAHVANETEIPGDLLTPVAHLVAQSGSGAEWDALYRQYKTAKTPQDETRYLYALGAFEDPACIAKTLDLYFSQEVRVQDGLYAIFRALRNRHAQAATWERIEREWDTLWNRYPAHMFQYAVQAVSAVVDDSLADRVAAWLNAHPVEGAERAVAQTLEFQDVYRRLGARIRGTIGSTLATAT